MRIDAISEAQVPRFGAVPQRAQSASGLAPRPGTWSARQQVLLAAIRDWDAHRIMPATQEQRLVAALATCSAKLLRAARVANAADAWRELDPEAIAVVAAAHAWSAPTVAPGSNPDLVARALQRRKRRHESQGVFWGRLGVTQTTACRYEVISRLPLGPLRILVSLLLAGEIDERDLERLRDWATGDAKGLERAKRRQLALALTQPEAWRGQCGMSQAPFWSLFGVTQSGGSRYEAGRPMPLPLKILMTARALGELSDAQLIRHACPSARRRQRVEQGA